MLNFFFNVLYSTRLHLPPLRSTVSEDAWIEPKTIATAALSSLGRYVFGSEISYNKAPPPCLG